MKNEFLFKVANEFISLTDRQKLDIGLRLKLVGVAATLYAPHYLEEKIFVDAYKNNMLVKLVAEIQKVKYGIEK